MGNTAVGSMEAAEVVGRNWRIFAVCFLCELDLAHHMSHCRLHSRRMRGSRKNKCKVLYVTHKLAVFLGLWRVVSAFIGHFRMKS